MIRLVLLLAALSQIAPAQVFPPFRILGNLYYVGDDDLASYLITTPKGDILINTGFEYSVPEIRARMKTLGFKFTDIKILLTTHAHSDHVGGMGTMRKQTGAKMLAIEQEVELLETGGKTDYLFGSDGWFNPVKVDRVFKDRDKIELGGTELTAYLTPGHTRGSVSYGWDIVENGKTYHVLIANLPSINPGTVLVKNRTYPKIADDYEKTFRLLDSLPCDVFLSSHISQFHLQAKYRPGMPYDPERLVDPSGLRQALARLYEKFLKEMDDQLTEEQAIQDRKHFKNQ
jgi:metallo-beta-lactamase class B